MHRFNPIPRPAQLTAENAGAFLLGDVVENYHLRAPYPSELGRFLLRLMPRGGRVLELGCGTGEIARMLAPHVERVDAVDVSAPMLAKARAMPGGDHPAIHWIHAGVEDVEFDTPYALAVAGDSLHWMHWETVLPRIGDALLPGAHLAIVSAKPVEQPWAAELLPPIRRYSVMRNFEIYDLIDLLGERDLFERFGDERLGPERFTRTVDEYIDALHATSGLARERMGADAACAFDEDVRRVVEPFAEGGVLELWAAADVAWGRARPKLFH